MVLLPTLLSVLLGWQPSIRIHVGQNLHLLSGVVLLESGAGDNWGGYVEEALQKYGIKRGTWAEDLESVRA